jgi:glycosyltransferase involved in cell wall biosynthesis
MDDKILVVSSLVPFPPDRGDRIRAHNMLKIMSKHFRVDLVTFSDRKLKEEDEEFFREYFNLEMLKTVEKKKVAVMISMLVNIPSEDPIIIAGYRSKKMKRIINEMDMKEYKYVYVMGHRMAQYINVGIRDKSVLDLCDSLSLNIKEQLTLRAGLIKRMYLKLNERKVHRYELWLKEQFPQIVLSSEYDKSWLGLDGEKCKIIRNIVEVESISTRESTTGGKIIVFLGDLSYAPNSDALRYFIEDIWPLIIMGDNEAELKVIGKKNWRTSKLIRRTKGVQELGYVGDIQKEMEKASVLVAPLRASTGIPNKILLAMAMDIPVVCTTKANKAIRASEEQNVFERDEPEEFAKEVLRILSSQSHYINNWRGREFVMEGFSPAAIEKSLLSLLHGRPINTQ